MATRGWKCDTCESFTASEPWLCPVCMKETCNKCFCKYGVCKKCSESRTDEECRTLANDSGMFEFDAPSDE